METIILNCAKCGTPVEYKGRYKNPLCKSCKKEYSMQKTQETRISKRNLKLQLIMQKGGCCSKCGYNEFPAALEFHHVNPSQKEFEISKIKPDTSQEDIANELDKCILLCCRCHRELHYTKKGQNNIYTEPKFSKNITVIEKVVKVEKVVEKIVEKVVTVHTPPEIIKIETIKEVVIPPIIKYVYVKTLDPGLPGFKCNSQNISIIKRKEENQERLNLALENMSRLLD